jgi:hypothetical protein
VTVLVRKPEGKRLLGRCKHKWEDDIRIEVRSIMYEGVDWVHLAQDKDL